MFIVFQMTSRLTRTWQLLKRTVSRQAAHELLDGEITVMTKSKMVNDKELKEKKDKLEELEQAFNESFAALREESKVVVESKTYADELFHLVRMQRWKVKLLVHDSTHNGVKQYIRSEAENHDLEVKMVQDNVILEH